MQTTKNILLVRPSNFIFNTETEPSNAFQVKVNDNEDLIKQKVLAEFEAFASTLQSKGINVFVFNDTAFPAKPDAIFTNNWVTFHPDGTVILYPMFAHNRRQERRQDMIDSLQKHFEVTNVIDLSEYEKENRFLAVSYTHLDVYKRQREALAPKSFWNLIQSLPPCLFALHLKNIKN